MIGHIFWILPCWIVLAAVCLVGPGLFFVRYLHWKPAETLVASVAASLLVIYVGTRVIFCMHFKYVVTAHWALTAICLILTLQCRGDLARLFHRRQVRRIAGAFGILWVWLLLLLAIIRHYAGGTWYGDWVEHYKRCLFFLEYWDAQYKFLGMYLVTARPPLMNMVCAHFMAMLGTDYEPYQLTAAFLNLLPALPCCLFASATLPRKMGRKAAIATLTLILAASPMFMEQATYAWTKSLTAFFALLSLWIYLSAWRKQDQVRFVAAFVCATAACLTHFYAVGWTAALAGHYLLVVWPKRPRKIREATIIGLVCALLATSWFAWAVAVYGPRVPFYSSTTAWSVQHETLRDRIATIGFDLESTFVPYFLRAVPYDQISQESHAGYLRDLAFNLYQTNAIFALGLAGIVAVIYLIRPGRRAPDAPAEMRRFWIFFFAVTIFLGVVSVPTPDDWGDAHLFLAPQILLILSALAGTIAGMRGGWRFAWIMACTIDFALGILLQVHLENRVYAVADAPGKTVPMVVMGSNLPSEKAQDNFVAKEYLHLRFIGDDFAGIADIAQAALCGMFVILVARTRPRVQAR
jgi:4-amino-4-deoxy-L-arabinose transferase-like glycosyltransferase